MSEDRASGPPSDEQVRLIIAQALEQVFLQAKASEQFLLELHRKVAGVEAVVPIIDNNQADAATARAVAAQKEMVSHLYERAQTYVAAVVAGAYAAYFATLSIVSARMSDDLLRISAILMTISLSIFVFWEVFSLSWTSFRIMKGDLQAVKSSRFLQIGWGAALLTATLSAVPAIIISIWSYARGF